MTPTEPTTGRGELIVFAKDQPEYIPLPARVDGHEVVTEWTLTEKERQAILRGENVRLTIMVYPTKCEACGTVRGGRLQPVMLAVTSEVEA